MTEQNMIRIGEKTAAQVLEASRIIQQARGVIETIAATLREVHGVPESWQLAQGADGNLYLQETDANSHTLEEHAHPEGQAEEQAPRNEHANEQTFSTA